MIVATLIEANQNSNSPYARTDPRLVAVIRIVRTSAISHSGPSIQRCRTAAPATASKPTTITQKYQYSQPLVNPAPSPSERRMSSVNEPAVGLADAISPSIRITRTIRMPVRM
jgi:hypothetical protein